MYKNLGFIVSTLLWLAGASPASAVTVTSFSPGVGTTGDQVTITGSGFFPGSIVVKFNGVQDPTAAATLADGTQIAARVPAGATTGPVSVSVNGGPPASSAQDFTVIGPGPYIISFNPSAGSAGTTVTVNGVHLNTATNAYFNGVKGLNFFVQTVNQLQVDAPPGVVSGPISLRSQYGTHVSSNFYVTPLLTGFSPTTGRAGTNVTITGSNLLGTTSVQFNGVAVVPANPTNNTSLTVAVPVGASTGPVRINTPAGSFISTSNFVVQPTIFGFSPGAGAIGTAVTLTGANFNVGNPTVRFNGTASAIVSNISFGQLTAVVPANATTGPISITTTNGSHTNSATFYVPASITSFTPTNSAPGTTVTITGMNLLGTTNVSFNGASANFTPPTNNTTLLAVVPAGVTTGPIIVSTPAGNASTSNKLFYAAPVITSFTPTHGLPGTNVTITGNNFLGTTKVKFNGLDASFTPPTNNTTIKAIVPTNAQTGPITVIAPAGTNTSVDNFVLDYNSDLALTLTASPPAVFVGSNLVYTLTLTNQGPLAAPNVFLTNTLPASVTLKSASTSLGTLATNANPIVGTIGTLAINSSVTVILTVTPQAAGNITNVAQAVSGNSDPTPANSTVTLVTTVLPLPVLSVQRLSTNLIRLSWPVQLTNSVLEYKSTLGGTWSSVSTAPVISGNERVVTETNSAAARFYRLRD